MSNLDHSGVSPERKPSIVLDLEKRIDNRIGVTQVWDAELDESTNLVEYSASDMDDTTSGFRFKIAGKEFTLPRSSTSVYKLHFDHNGMKAFLIQLPAWLAKRAGLLPHKKQTHKERKEASWVNRNRERDAREAAERTTLMELATIREA